MLVLTGMPVWRGDQADLKGMLDDRHLAPVGLAGELEHCAETRQSYVMPLAGLHHRDSDFISVGHLTTCYVALLGVVELGDGVVEPLQRCSVCGEITLLLRVARCADRHLDLLQRSGFGGR